MVPAAIESAKSLQKNDGRHTISSIAPGDSCRRGAAEIQSIEGRADDIANR